MNNSTIGIELDKNVIKFDDKELEPLNPVNKPIIRQFIVSRKSKQVFLSMIERFILLHLEFIDLVNNYKIKIKES